MHLNKGMFYYLRLDFNTLLRNFSSFFSRKNFATTKQKNRIENLHIFITDKFTSIYILSQ